jgi:hypothetical protein
MSTQASDFEGRSMNEYLGLPFVNEHSGVKVDFRFFHRGGDSVGYLVASTDAIAIASSTEPSCGLGRPGGQARRFHRRRSLGSDRSVPTRGSK